jgi:hypothetical protein
MLRSLAALQQRVYARLRRAMALRGVSKQRPRRDREGWVEHLGRLSFETGAGKSLRPPQDEAE